MESIKTVKVSASGPDGWAIKTIAGKHTVLVDQPQSMGGSDSAPTPLEYIFIALGSCLVTVAKIVASQKRINLRKVDVEISGDINLAVLRGQERNERAGFRSIDVKVNIDAELSKEEKMDFLHEVDQRCPVSDNLLNTTPINLALA